MSKEETNLLFEGFLQKRKDTMKIRWKTYWFRLQNTTLFFYTKENCNAAHLRGYYYIYTVQSVREVQREDSKRFMFEIIMTNGKRKMLAAETAALRQEWVNNLWQAMHLSNSVFLNSRNTNLEHRDRIHSIVPTSSQTDSVMESLPPRPLSAPTVHMHHDISSITATPCLLESHDNQEPTYQNLQLPCSDHSQDGERLDAHQGSTGFNCADRGPEGDYDVLPRRTKLCEINDPTEIEEVVYDVPVCHKRADEHADTTENVYDVPSTLRKASFYNSGSDPLLSPDAEDTEEQPMNEVCWRI